MATFNVSDIGESIVLHFQSEEKRINAYTLASTLVSIADAARAANASINPGYEIEIVVEAFGEGSFRAKITGIYKSAKDLFSGRSLKAIILGVIAAAIHDSLTSDEITVIVNTDEVVIEYGRDRVIVPREIYEARESAQSSPQFRNAIARTYEVLGIDESLTGVGIVTRMDAPPPKVVVSRESMRRAAIPIREEPDERVIYEQCELDIVKAILKQGKRKWEFVWHGVRITAPMLDTAFHSRFKAHEITIAPGDRLDVRLAIKQRRDPKTGIYTNLSYEVIEVFKHIPAEKQLGF